MKNFFAHVVCLVSFGLCSLIASAQVPQLINYQGRLLNGTNLMNGNVGLSLRLFNVSVGGTTLYEDSNSVAVVDGLYSTFIGDNTTAGSLAVALTNAQVWIEVAVNGTALTPRERAGSVAYAQAVRGFLLLTNGASVVSPGTNTMSPGATASVIAGGVSNAVIAGGTNVVIGGGQGNTAGDYGTTVAGGTFNFARGYFATIGGGQANAVSNTASTVAGGKLNEARGTGSTIGGGLGNYVSPIAGGGTVAGGRQSYIDSDDGAIAGGYNNGIDTNAALAVISGGGQNLIGTGGTNGVIGGGINNQILPRAGSAVIGGGEQNQAGASYATVGGGTLNIATGVFATVGGGQVNVAGGQGSTVAGGRINEARATVSAIGGGVANYIDPAATGATIAGGRQSALLSGSAFVGGGFENTVDTNSDAAAIGGGYQNSVGANAPYSTIGGGNQNQIIGTAPGATIPGGQNNTVAAGATNGIASGYRAQVLHPGSYVWADNTDADFASTTNNQFNVRAGGGVRIRAKMQIGSGTNAGQGTRGIIFRRIESTDLSAGIVAARTDKITLERDGTYGGIRIVNQNNSGGYAVAAFGVSSNGTPVGIYISIPTTAATNTLFANAANVVCFHASLGNHYANGEVTEIFLTREATDYFWIGTVTSSYDQ